MDPDVALAKFVAAACAGDTAEMSHHYHALKEWLDRGGFPPDPFQLPIQLNLFPPPM